MTKLEIGHKVTSIVGNMQNLLVNDSHKVIVAIKVIGRKIHRP